MTLRRLVLLLALGLLALGLLALGVYLLRWDLYVGLPLRRLTGHWPW